MLTASRSGGRRYRRRRRRPARPSSSTTVGQRQTDDVARAPLDRRPRTRRRRPGWRSRRPCPSVRPSPGTTRSSPSDIAVIVTAVVTTSRTVATVAAHGDRRVDPVGARRQRPQHPPGVVTVGRFAEDLAGDLDVVSAASTTTSRPSGPAIAVAPCRGPAGARGRSASRPDAPIRRRRRGRPRTAARAGRAARAGAAIRWRAPAASSSAPGDRHHGVVVGDRQVVEAVGRRGSRRGGRP